MSRIPVDSSSRSCWSSKGSPSISAKHFGRLPIAPFNRLPQPAARIIACPTPSALLRAARNRWSFRTIGWKDIGRPKMTLWNGSTQPDQIISGSVTDLLQRGRRAAGVRRPARGVRLWCKWPSRANAPFYAVQTSSRKHRVPDCRRSSALNAQPCQCELSLADAVHQLDAGDRDRRIPEPLEA